MMERARTEPPLAANASNLDRLAQWLRPLASVSRLKLLQFLTTPHYLEEVASHLRLTRQAARSHLDQLVEIGVLDRQSGVRASGPVTEYVINPQALFVIYDEFEKLSTLKRQENVEILRRTVPATGARAVGGAAEGPALTIVRGLNVGRRFPLQMQPNRAWTVGRDPKANLSISHDPYVSNRHAEIRLERGRFVVTDLASTNGTEHNWSLLPRGAEVALHHGDVIGVGKTLVLFWDASPT